jgi:glycosyltransferase involved in cell wall biosynthesis
MPRRSILIFYPHNFYELSAGTHRRMHALLGYFRSRNFSIHLLTLSGFSNVWDSRDAARTDLFDSLSVCDWRPRITHRFYREWMLKAGRLNDLTTFTLRRTFKNLVEAVSFDYILIHYVFWASLIDLARKESVRVIDLHDFMTLSRFQHEEGQFRLGKMFQDEIGAISKFDHALSISEEESVRLSPFCRSTRFENVPYFCAERFCKETHCDFDLLIIGSDNELNRKGLQWFIREVAPRLPAGIRIAVSGKISRFVEGKNSIVRLDYVEDLEELYSRSLIACCPVIGGTGLKIKVVEALSFGKPVVTTPWGLVGMLQKEENGCLSRNNGEEFAGAIQQLVNDPGAYRKQQDLAKQFFKNQFSNAVVYRKLDQLFLDNRRFPAAMCAGL